jgi:hypothetical protein
MNEFPKGAPRAPLASFIFGFERVLNHFYKDMESADISGRRLEISYYSGRARHLNLNIKFCIYRGPHKCEKTVFVYNKRNCLRKKHVYNL